MNHSRRSPRSGNRGYAHLVEIDVSVPRVWRALTDPASIRVWSADDAEIDARKGGFYRFGNRNAGGREAHIDIFDINRRLRLIYLKGRDSPSGDSAVVDDFLLGAGKREGTAALRLLGSGVPDAPEWDRPYMRMRMNWERLLARIKATLEKPTPEPRRPPPKDPPLPGLDY